MKWKLVPVQPTDEMLDAVRSMVGCPHAEDIIQRLLVASPNPLDDAELVEAVAKAIHTTRIKWHWTLGVRKGPMAIDYEMARVAIAAMTGGE